jgi:maltose alpha-D-glucosyltransferase/alpha-amylase
MAGLLFSLPGTPVIYYGDEIGMGDNIYLGDRDGVRTPMQWSPDRNAGFSRANPQRLYLPVVTDPEYHYEAVNVEVQQNNAHSMLWWYKRLIGLRKQLKAFGRGSIEFLLPENNKVLAFTRSFQDENVLVVANLSRFAQGVDLDLSKYRDWVPVEVFGGTEFPAIQKERYFITLGPHSFYWFSLNGRRTEISVAREEPKCPSIAIGTEWSEILEEGSRELLEKALPQFLSRSRWSSGKSQKIRGVGIEDVVPLSNAEHRCYLVLARATYSDADPSTYQLVLAFAEGAAAAELCERHPNAVVARLALADGKTGLLHDALVHEGTAGMLLQAIGGRRRFKGQAGVITPTRTAAFGRIARGAPDGALPVRHVGSEERNATIVYGDRFVLKILRQVEPGPQPDLEVGRFLTEFARFEHAPPVAGAIEYTRPGREPTTLAVLQGFVPNEGDAWKYTVDAVGRYLDEAVARKDLCARLEPPRGPLLTLLGKPPPPETIELFPFSLDAARILGRRTGELHLALASGPAVRDFALEPYTTLYQHSVYQSMRSRASQTLSLLSQRTGQFSEELRAEAREVLKREASITRRLRTITDRKLSGSRIRIHGDYHLGQVLYTGKDFIIIDFEGEPARPLSERRLKRSPLRDVAGMIRSFHYAAYASLFDSRVRHQDMPAGEPLVKYWYAWVSAVYLESYLETVAGSALLPRTTEETKILLDAFLIDKSLYELAYELNHRPDWIAVPVRGVLDLVRD